MTNSIVSYPNRGNYGKSSWRGNCSGHLIREMLEHFKPRVFCDPMTGGNTSGDVVAEMRNNGSQIEFHGLDLHSGFNLLKDSLSERIGGKRACYIFAHPPYFDIVKYSGAGNQWGREAHPDDLSRCPNYEDFLTKMQTALQNIYEALSANGAYSILIGDVRRGGEYLSIQSDLLQIAPGKLDGVLIKAQHNCVSDRTKYSNGNFIKIGHEYLLNFRNDRAVFGMLDASLKVSRKLELLSRANWAATVRTALNKLGGAASLPEIYKAIERDAPEKVALRVNWQARVRATLQTQFRSFRRGVWAIA